MTRSSVSGAALKRADRLHRSLVHLQRRLRREDEEGGVTSAELSALTTLASFGTLGASTHLGMASLGRLLLLGMTLILLSTLVVLPALIALRGSGSRERG